MSLSSIKSEYRALVTATQEYMWLIQLMKDIHQPVEHEVQLHCYNQSAIHLTENPVFYARTKHVEVHYHFV